VADTDDDDVPFLCHPDRDAETQLEVKPVDGIENDEELIGAETLVPDDGPGLLKLDAVATGAAMVEFGKDGWP
jgi:hypothetical protein